MAAIPLLITQADCELACGPAMWGRMLSDDGSGVVDPEKQTHVLRRATDTAIGILWSGFPSTAQIRLMVDADAGVRGAIVDLALGYAGERRPGLLDDQGRSPFSGLASRGEKALKEIARGERRAAGESVAGPNATLQVSVEPNRTQRPMIFPAPNDDDYGGGGF